MTTPTVVAIAAGAMAAIAALRITSPSSGMDGLTFLFAVPVALVGVRLGAAAAATAAVAALGLTAMWDTAGGSPGPSGYGVRAIVFGMVAVLAARSAPPPPAGAPEARRHAASEPPATPDSRLSPRETEVLRLIAQGYTNREIAEQLVLSVRTVETHRARIHSKLGCKGRSALYHHARSAGLVDAA